MTNSSEQKQFLEEFICDKELKKLEKKFDIFNIFDCLQLTHIEIRHSNFLSWLFNPNETHGFSDYFLKEFLKEVLRKAKKEVINIKGYNIPSIVDIDCWDMSDTQVYRELQNIDILIVNETNKFVLVIENKIDSCQHDNQLTRYREFIDNQYPSNEYAKLFLYLKPKPEHVEYPYIYISYELIKNLLEDLVKERKENLNPDVTMAIQHYIKIIGRDIMEKDEIKILCKRIYANHAKALDLINRYSDSRSEVYEALIELIKNDDDLILDESDKNWIRFIPKTADSAKLNIAKRDWVKSDRILLFEIHNNKASVDLDIIIRQTENEDILNTILDIAQNHFQLPNFKKDLYKHIVSTPLISSDKYNEIILKDCNEIQEYLSKQMKDSKIIEKFNQFAQECSNKL